MEYETKDVTQGRKINNRQKPRNFNIFEFKTTARIIANSNMIGTSTTRNKKEFPNELQNVVSWNSRTKLPKPTNVLLSPDSDEKTSFTELRIG